MNKLVANTNKKPQIVSDLEKLGYVVSESRPAPKRLVLTIGKKEGKK
jgi:hypothetical protein